MIPASIALMLSSLLSIGAPPAGMFNAYFKLDEAMGYRGVRDDISELFEAGITLFHHYFQDEYARDVSGKRFWGGLPLWLKAYPREERRLSSLKSRFGPGLGWRLFFWRSYLDEVKKQTEGKGGILIGEMYAMFAASRDWEGLRRFVEEMCRYEAESFPGGIAGWYIAEEPNSIRKRYKPELCGELIRRIKAAEREGGWREHRIFIDLSAGHPSRKVVPFLKDVDVVMISPDAYIWAARARNEFERYLKIPRAVRRMRELLRRAGNEGAEVHIALQAYGSKPDHLGMHQQIRLALSSEHPADGVWFWWWHDCKSTQVKGIRTIRINRWDPNTPERWGEAIRSELGNAERAVRLEGEHRWRGKVFLIGDLIVPKGSRLTVEPGTVVELSPRDLFGGGVDPNRCEIIVRGELMARSAFFTCRRGSWYGIRVEGGSARLSGCRLVNALKGR